MARASQVVRLIGDCIPETGTKLVPRVGRRRGKWRPLGSCQHVASDPALVKFALFFRGGKHTLMNDLVRHAADTYPDIDRLVKKWDSLSPGAQRAVTLTDLCMASQVPTARLIATAIITAHRISRYVGCVVTFCNVSRIPEKAGWAIIEESKKLLRVSRFGAVAG